MKGGVRIINLARGGLVSDDAIIDGLESGRVAKYITDFPDNHLVQTKNVVAMPHLGASTQRARPTAPSWRQTSCGTTWKTATSPTR